MSCGVLCLQRFKIFINKCKSVDNIHLDIGILSRCVGLIGNVLYGGNNKQKGHYRRSLFGLRGKIKNISKMCKACGWVRFVSI